MQFFAALVLLAGVPTGADVQASYSNDGPLVAHVVVALCDNEFQGIAPTTKTLGDGQNPKTNLYWGALYGVRTHLLRSGWTRVEHQGKSPDGVLDRIVLRRMVKRGKKQVTAYVVADAYDGRAIKDATQTFLRYSSGRDVFEIAGVKAGGGAQVVAYVGHNGLMGDFTLEETPKAVADTPARSSIVLACASETFFKERLDETGSHSLLLTTGLMAPEAYVLEASLRAWFSGRSSTDVREEAAKAYDKYQKCGIRGARRLFKSAE